MKTFLWIDHQFKLILQLIILLNWVDVAYAIKKWFFVDVIAHGYCGLTDHDARHRGSVDNPSAVATFQSWHPLQCSEDTSSGTHAHHLQALFPTKLKFKIDFVNLKSNSVPLYNKGHNLLTSAFPQKNVKLIKFQLKIW